MSIGKARLPMKILDYETFCDFEVVRPEVLGGKECYLGWDFIKSNKVKLDFDTQLMTIHKREVNMMVFSRMDKCSITNNLKKKQEDRKRPA